MTRLEEAKKVWNTYKDDKSGFKNIYERRIDMLQVIFEIDFKANPTAEEWAWMEPLMDEAIAFANTENF